MLSEERKTCDRAIIKRNRFHLLEFNDIGESHLFQEKLKGGILQSPGTTRRDDNGADLVTYLEKGLEKDVILVIVGDQDKVDSTRQVFIGIARDLRFVRVTQDGIQQHTDAGCFHENTGVPEVPPANAATDVRLIRLGRFAREHRAEEFCLAVGDGEAVANLSPRLR